MYLTICKASAGSGKTFNLAAEYVADLVSELFKSLNDGKIPVHAINAHQCILAITFTNKATAEMKERILQYLYSLSQKTDPDFQAKVIEKLQNNSYQIPAEHIPALSAKALQDILHDYNHFYVITIDSFFQRLLSSLARELDLPANLKVDINDTEAINEAVDLLLRDPEKSELEWLKSYIVQRNKDSENWHIADTIKNFATDNLLSEDYQLLPKSEKDFISDNKKMKDYIQKIRKKKETIEKQFIEYVKPFSYEFEKELANISDKRSISSYLKNMPQAPSPTIQSILSGEKHFLLKKAQASQSNLDLENTFIKKLKELEDLRKETSVLTNTIMLILKHLSPLRLLNAIENKLNIINAEHNRFLLSKTKLLFHTLIDEKDSPFIYEKTGNQYKHILIDEFQDTAKTQWNNIQQLLLNSMSEGNSNLIVGDIKQSIYRWNGGDWKLLNTLEKEEKLSCMGSLSLETLNENYRSKCNIVNFNNDFFVRAAETLGQQEIYSETSTYQIAKKGSGGYVYACISNAKAFNPLGSEDHYLFQQIIKLHELGVEWKDMCILVRSKIDAKKIIEQNTDIPIVSDEAFLLNKSMGVLTIIHLLKFLDNPKDTFSEKFAARAFTQYILKKDLNIRETSLPDTFTTEIPFLKTMPLYELILRLIELFRLDELEEGASYILTLLDQTLEYIKSNAPTIKGFLKKWEVTLQYTAIPVSKVNAVRILTIHKSKGLEFHTVFIPFCTWNLAESKSDNNSFIWWKNTYTPPKEDEVNAETANITRIPITPNKMAKESLFADQFNEEMKMRYIDNLNLAYVAFTRPRCNLFIWGTYSGNNNDNMGNLLSSTLGNMPEFFNPRPSANDCKESPLVSHKEADLIIYEKGTPEASIPKKNIDTKDNPFIYTPQETNIAFKSYPARLSFRQSNESLKFITELQGDDSSQLRLMDRGKIYHKIMQSTKTEKDLPNAISHLIKIGVIAETEKETLLKRFREYISTCPKWFDSSWNVYTETTLLKSGHKEHRADRIMTRGDETIVIDFKFAQKEESAHIRQVQEYMCLLKEVRSQVKGFLWYVDKGIVMPVYLPNNK